MLELKNWRKKGMVQFKVTVWRSKESPLARWHCRDLYHEWVEFVTPRHSAPRFQENSLYIVAGAKLKFLVNRD
jgi:hypothetical protein